jgi:hypothetical protein
MYNFDVIVVGLCHVESAAAAHLAPREFQVPALTSPVGARGAADPDPDL